MGDNSDLMGAVLSWYMQQQGNKPPKFYNVPLTPFQQWQQNQTQGLYGYVGNYANQFVNGLNGMNPSDFHFVSPALQGQQFAGGMQMPKFNFSGMSGGSTPGTGATGNPNGPNMNPDGTPNLHPPTGGTTPPGGGSTTPPWLTGGTPPIVKNPYGPNGEVAGVPGGIKNQTGPPTTGGDPQWGETIADWLTQNPGGNPRPYLPNGGQPPGGQPGGGAFGTGNNPNFFSQVNNWWTNFVNEHPDWVKMGWDGIKAAATAAFGPLGSIAAIIISHLAGTGGPKPGGSPTTGGH